MPKDAKPKRKAAEKAEKVAKPKAKKEKDPSAPKKPRSPFLFFCSDWRERIKAENPDAKFGDLGKLLGAKWKELAGDEKKTYTKQAAEDKTRYEEEMEAYRSKPEEGSGGEQD
ncbi:hypothetical protein BOTBODRAFT_30512 [Botryobasidium botryosum FD-172 SS1]|uniref:HMG box domain-containing protein n=1 Tax=Botryobasidium botryosum (strain FD-172 SS1) TaxID=930990 RepID=A0A067MNK0_BOTB1|nr:hypothetical protein BOTBODRAFT_30512 [Botryobasidium botryosum FD-172 SS1]